MIQIFSHSDFVPYIAVVLNQMSSALQGSLEFQGVPQKNWE